MILVTVGMHYQGFDRLFIVNGHGYNTASIQVVGQKVPCETDALCATCDYFSFADDIINKLMEEKTEAHAGEMETSIMMNIVPEWVLPLNEAGDGSSKKLRFHGRHEGWLWAPGD